MRAPQTLRFRAAALLLAVGGSLHGLFYIPFVALNETEDSRTYLAAGRALRRGSYTTPLEANLRLFTRMPADVTGLAIPERVWSAPERQAFRPPGYPALLTLAGASKTAALGLNVVLFGVGALLLALTVRRWWGPTAGLGAEALYALDPYSKHDVALVLSEPLAAVLVLAGAYALTRAWSGGSIRWWAAAGLLSGALTLTRVAFVLTLPLLVLAALLRGGRPGRRLGAAGAALACALALVVPWLAWTNHVVGKPVLAVYGEGLNLAVAAYGEGVERTQGDVVAEPAFERVLERSRRSAPAAAAMLRDPFAHPRYLRRADESLRASAWARYEHRLRHEPEEVAWEALYRAYFLWQAHEDWYQPAGLALLPLRLLDWVVTALAVFGAALALRRGGPAAGIVVLLAVYTFAIALHHVEARFAMPLRGLELGLVALALGEIWRRAHPRIRPR